MHILKYTLFKKKYSDYNCIKLCLGYVCLSSYVCGGKEGKEAREMGVEGWTDAVIKGTRLIQSHRQSNDSVEIAKRENNLSYYTFETA